MLCRWCSQPAETGDTCNVCESVIAFLDTQEAEDLFEPFTDHGREYDR